MNTVEIKARLFELEKAQAKDKQTIDILNRNILVRAGRIEELRLLVADKPDEPSEE